MSYQALNFIYDDIPSEKFGVFICNMDDGMQSSDGGGEVKLITDKTISSDRSYLLGIEYDDMFEFKLTFGRYEPPDRHMISLLNTWLVGHSNYKPLRIVQADMSTVYYECIMTDFQISTFGNIPYVFECSVVCNRPYGIGNRQKHSYNIKAGENRIVLRNTSNTSNITMPTLSFTTTKADAELSIKNVSNNGYETKFTGLAVNETLTVDCDLQMITSSLQQRRLQNFNKHWLELLPNVNNLIVTGDISNLVIEYDPIKKMG